MKITKHQLRQLIEQELNEISWADALHPESKWASGPVYQINDTLVSAVEAAILKQFLESGLLGKGPGLISQNDLALELEEPLMDALLPIAEKVSAMLGHDPSLSQAQPEEDFGEDEEPGAMLHAPVRADHERMIRGARTGKWD